MPVIFGQAGSRTLTMRVRGSVEALLGRGGRSSLGVRGGATEV